MPTVIGVISDTHGLVREEALLELQGAELIIHAGDAGKPEVLEVLSRIAPVYAVRGNVDTGAWADELPLTRELEVEGARVFVVHNIAEMDFDPASRGFAAVVTGHSHKARQDVRNGVLYLNPGSAGPLRFRLPATVARMSVDGGSVQVEIVSLGVT